MTSLVEQGTATALVELLKTVPVDTKLAEAGLCALRSVFLHPPAPISALPADMRLLTRLTRKFVIFIAANKGCVTTSILLKLKIFILHLINLT